MSVVFRIFILAVSGFAFGLLAVNIVPRLIAPPPAAPEPPRALNPPALEVSASELEQGDTLVAAVSGFPPPVAATATLGSATVPVLSAGGKLILIAGIDVNAAIGKTTLTLTLPSGARLERELVIQRRTFPVTRLELPPALKRAGVTPARLTRRIETLDQAILDEIFALVSPQAYFTAAFRQPLDNWVDAGSFGVIRRAGAINLRHLGADLEARLGDPVSAANDGMVRFAGELELFGKTIVIDHGLGIFTVYLHLSEIRVRVGERVERGQGIATVGATGAYVLAPHLHFSVKIRGAPVDPKRFIETTQKFLK